MADVIPIEAGAPAWTSMPFVETPGASVSVP